MMKKLLAVGLLAVWLLTGCGDQKAKDRAAASRAEAEAYRVKQEAAALATAVAVSSENQALAMQALSTQAAVSNEIQATSAAIQVQATAIALQFAQQQPSGGSTGLTTGGSAGSTTGFDLADVLPWAMLGLTLGSAFVSVGLAVVATRRQSPEREIVYVGGSGPRAHGGERVRLLEPGQLLLRPLSPGQSQARRLLRDGRGT